MGIFSKILHKIFRIELDVDECKTCAVLQHELECLRRENERIFLALLAKESPKEIPVSPSVAPNPNVIRTGRFVPSRVRQQYVEAEDRRSLEIMREVQKKMKEAGVPEKNIPSPTTPKETSTEELEEEIMGFDKDKEIEHGIR